MGWFRVDLVEGERITTHVVPESEDGQHTFGYCFCLPKIEIDFCEACGMTHTDVLHNDEADRIGRVGGVN